MNILDLDCFIILHIVFLYIIFFLYALSGLFILSLSFGADSSEVCLNFTTQAMTDFTLR